jgi:pimeloyl-ACP methyl ester carboxylesterase
VSATGSQHGADDAAASVVSADGTTIGYRSHGRGPGLVIVHGAMESATDYMDLASMLGGSVTVHVPDRRGRGLSGPHGEAFGLSAEIDDVRAVCQATGARQLFGVSSGGVIALHAALELPGIDRVAVYEPALSPPGVDPAESSDYVERYERALTRGHIAEALVAVLKGIQMGPRWLRLLPRPLATALIRRFIGEEDKTATDGAVTFGSLVPTMHYDFQVCDEGSTDLPRFEGLPRPVLLLGGTKSPRYLATALSRLEELLPHCRRVQLPGVGHTASANRQEGGRPDLVARELLTFLASSDATTSAESPSGFPAGHGERGVGSP